MAETVTFLGGPLDGQRTVPPTPVDDGDDIGVPHEGRFLIYRKAGGFMTYVDTVDITIGPENMPVGTFKSLPPQS